MAQTSLSGTYNITTIGTGQLWTVSPSNSTVTPIKASTTTTITCDELNMKPVNGASPKIVTHKHTIDIDLLYETVQLLAERLAVLAVDKEVLEKYPTLKDAYEQYQLLANIIDPNKKEI